MVARDIRLVSTGIAPSYRVTLTLTVEDARALWSAAAARAMQAPGMTLEDVLDTLGPREDPSISDCIAMLTAPSAIAGCALEDYGIADARSGAELLGTRMHEPRRMSAWGESEVVVGMG